MAKKYEVTIKTKEGSCAKDLFEKMAKNGDLTSTKVSDIVDSEITIKGHAKCNIVTDDKNFDINYYDTEEYGLVSSGSEIFAESVVTYLGDTNKFRVNEIKTKKGKTYKAVPIILNDNIENDLPF